MSNAAGTSWRGLIGAFSDTIPSKAFRGGKALDVLEGWWERRAVGSVLPLLLALTCAPLTHAQTELREESPFSSLLDGAAAIYARRVTERTANSDLDRPLVATRTPWPDPRKSRPRAWAFTAKVSFVVQPDGSVTEVSVTDANPESMASVVQQTVESWTFEPPMIQGRPSRRRISQTLILEFNESEVASRLRTAAGHYFAIIFPLDPLLDRVTTDLVQRLPASPEARGCVREFLGALDLRDVLETETIYASGPASANADLYKLLESPVGGRVVAAVTTGRFESLTLEEREAAHAWNLEQAGARYQRILGATSESLVLSHGHALREKCLQKVQ